MNKLDGKFFWKRIDDLNPYKSVKMLMDKASVDYNTIKKQRSELRYPKIETIIAIANTLDCSLDYLLLREVKQKQKKSYPIRIEVIADKLCKVSDQNLSLIENTISLMPIEDKSIKVNVVS